MPFCSFAEGAAMFDVTPIENMFLLEYLPTAPEDFLRVYLYARMLCMHPELGGSLEDVARALRLEEDAVLNAFRYWEQQGLVQGMTDRPPTFAILPMRAESLPSPMDRDYYEFRDYNNSLQNLFGPDLMHPHETAMAHDWVTVFGYSQEAVLRLVEYHLGKWRSRPGHRSLSNTFKKLDKVAAAWAERGVRTLEDVEQAILRDEGAYQAAAAVVRQFSLRRQPTADEIAYAQKWLQEWGFSQEDIIAACAETVKTANPSFAYLDAVLKNRRSGGDGEAREGLKRVLEELGTRAAITPAWQRSYQAMLASGFAPKTIEMAAVQVAAGNHHRFEDLEWMVGQWQELGLFSPEAAEAYIRANQALEREMAALLKRCGLDRRPRRSELKRYVSWKEAFPAEILAFAADCALNKKEPVAYMDRILAAWQSAGVRTLEEAETQNAAALAAGREAAEGTRRGDAPSQALNYQQREYKDEDFGDDFFDNFSDDLGGDQA